MKHSKEKKKEKNPSKNDAVNHEFLNHMNTKTFITERSNLSENKEHATDLLDSMKSIKSNKLK